MEKIGIIIQMLSGGGAERTAANLSIDLSSEYEVHLIVFDGNQTTYNHGGVVHNLDLPAKKGLFNKLLTLYKRIIAVRRIKKEEGFKAVISLLEGANIVNVLTRQKEKVIVSERNLISFFIKNKAHIMLEKAILNRANCVVALSEVVRQDLISNFSTPPQKIVTIYNSVDISKFNLGDEPEKSQKSDIPCFVTMGRLTKQKAQWHIFRSLKKVTEKYPEAKLIVIGQGELKEQYERFIQKLNIEKNVEFLGFLANPHSCIKKADIFVFTSIVEGLGSVLLEALACGKPIISTDCDAGPREILAPDTDPILKTRTVEYARYGVLVPVTQNDVFNEDVLNLSYEEMLLAEAMLKMIEDFELRRQYEEMAKERMNDFSPNTITQKWVEVIR